MARKPSSAGVRTTPVSTRLTAGEIAWLDGARGSLNRAEYLRMLLVRARRADKEATYHQDR